MGVTISTHNGSTVAREHNIRNPKVVSKEPHIDKKGIHEIWVDEPVRQAYERIFGKAVADYNVKQSRPERRINSYYNDICKDIKKHPVYEMIIGVYGKDNNGLAICSAESGKKIMHEFIDNWKERNPNLELIGAYYHADEDGEPHVHIDYVPVAHGYKKGLETQTGLVKALGEQGFDKFGKSTAQIQWEKRENDYLTTICETVGLKVDHPKIDGREHLETQVLKLQKRVEELEQAERATEDAEKCLEELEGKIMEQAEINALNGKRSLTGGLKGISYTEYLGLKKTAEKVDTVDLRERNLTEREQKIAVRESNISEEESNMTQKCSEMASTIHDGELRIQDLSERERVLNEHIVALEEEYQNKIKIIGIEKERYYFLKIDNLEEANVIISEMKNNKIVFSFQRIPDSNAILFKIPSSEYVFFQEILESIRDPYINPYLQR